MRILLIEDDETLCRSLRLSLEKQGFSVTLCHDGEEGLFAMLEEAHDLVLLDRMLPGLAGEDVLRRAREKGLTVPVIFLTALGSLMDRVEGLNAGADDYIVKPFAFEELMARIGSVTRRPRAILQQAVLSCGDLTFDEAQSLLTCGVRHCTLSKREGELMALFMNNPGQTLPRSTCLLRVWGAESEVESGNLDNYIFFLRRRLRAVESAVTIVTVRGIGYRLQVPA